MQRQSYTVAAPKIGLRQQSSWQIALKESLHKVSIEAESLKESLSEACALKDKLENQLLQMSEELKNSVPAVNQSLAANEDEVDTLKQLLREESDNVMHLTDELTNVVQMLKDTEERAASGAEELIASKFAQKGLKGS
jgi:predicted RNase H-like nuclease (RuvC/YqgF family)